MATTSKIPEALDVAGDDRIARLLDRADTIVVPAFACRLDGFVNDTFTEYANPSVYRPASVCRAQLISTLQDTVRPAGRYYFGFTMYTTAGHDERIELWIGHRQVARARLPEPDNRLHLFVVPDSFPFKGGEPVRLVTAATHGPCRIENLVLLKQRPRPATPKLDIRFPHVDLRPTRTGVEACLTWITSRPATGQLRWKKGNTPAQKVPLPELLVNHQVVLEDLEANCTCTYELLLQDGTGMLKAAHQGTFQTHLAQARSRIRQDTFPLLSRRAVPATWPISAGVPFPRGALGTCEHLRLLDAEKREIPLQARPLSHWPDNSVRWALLDFQHTGREDLQVEYGRAISPSRPETPLQIVETPAGIVVTTGPLQVEFPRNAAVFPGIVSLRQPEGTYQRLTPKKPSPSVTLKAGDGTVYTVGCPRAVVLEEAGPERACVRLEFEHQATKGPTLFRSIFRIHLFRDSSALRVLHTFENDCTDVEFTAIRSLSLRADFEVGPSPEGRLGSRRTGPLQQGPFSLQQTHDNRYTLSRGRQVLARGRRAKGQATLQGRSASIGLALRDFWENYPKGLELDRGGFTLQLCPPLDRKAYPKGNEEEDRLYYYLQEGQYRLKCGVSRTHEFWFHFHPGRATLPQHFFTRVQSPPLFSASLETCNHSQATILLPDKENSPYPPYETWVEAAQQAYAQDREESRAYGMLNYGDWFGERTYNWGNLEYDATWCFLQEYLRGGHPDFYTWAEEAAHHLVDVDTCHYSAEAGQVNGQYVHCVGHVGGYYPHGFRERAIFEGRWSPSHTWVEGLFLYHLLTGEKRALESAEKTCHLLAGTMLNHYDFSNCRNSGWHLIHLAAAYRTTGRRLFLNAARLIVDRVLERQRSSGGWDRLMVPGHCFCDPPRHRGNAGFMVGILMVGLTRYWEATGDQRAARSIVRAADYCIDTMWVPEQGSFHYTCCPESSIGRGADMRILKGIATAYRFSGSERFRQILQQGLESALASPPRAHRGVGKSICSPMRGAPQVLADLPPPPLTGPKAVD